MFTFQYCQTLTNSQFATRRNEFFFDVPREERPLHLVRGDWTDSMRLAKCGGADLRHADVLDLPLFDELLPQK